MKSSKDIEPRVGMQVRFFGSAAINVTSTGDPDWAFIGYLGGYYWTASKDAWEHGKYDVLWIPPTDEERKMFVEAAIRAENFSDPFKDRDGDACIYDAAEDLGPVMFVTEIIIVHASSICYSLALDGADYDNMPEGFI